MMKMTKPTLALAALLLAMSGCETTAPTKTLEQFDWVSVQDQSTIQEGIDATSFAGDIDFLGQFKTPSLCFNLVPTFSKSGSDLTLRIDAKNTNSSNCSQTPGGFQYTGVLRFLARGTYTLHVIHAVEGQAAVEYTQTLTI